MHIKDQNGFTLIEIIAVLIILGILIAVAVPRFFDIPDDAEKAAFNAAVVELNARENLAWARWRGDGIPYTAADIRADLKGFEVNEDNTILTSTSQQKQANVTRTAHDPDTPGKWTLGPFLN